MTPEPGIKEYMPETILQDAMGKYAEVLIIGVDKDDNVDVKATIGLRPVQEMNWLLDSVKFNLIAGAYGGEE